MANDELAGPRGDGYRRMIELSPAGRASTADEIGTAAAFLMGPDSAFITGSDLLMDGGATAAYFYGALARPDAPARTKRNTPTTGPSRRPSHPRTTAARRVGRSTKMPILMSSRRGKGLRSVRSSSVRSASCSGLQPPDVATADSYAVEPVVRGISTHVAPRTCRTVVRRAHGARRGCSRLGIRPGSGDADAPGPSGSRVAVTTTSMPCATIGFQADLGRGVPPCRSPHRTPAQWSLSSSML